MATRTAREQMRTKRPAKKAPSKKATAKKATAKKGTRARPKGRATATALPSIGRPATRALAAVGITSLAHVAKRRRLDLAALHGVGPRALAILDDALADVGLDYARNASTDAQAHDGRAQVDALLAVLRHPRTDEIQYVRDALLGVGLDEHVKWNAPSFRASGDDRVTFGLQPRDVVQLVLHRGAKKKSDAFSFVDDAGLVQWLASDRGIVTFTDMRDVQSKRAALTRLVHAWVAATT